MRALGREENHVVAFQRKPALTGGFTQHALATVPIDGVTKPLRRDEGDPWRVALVKLSQSNAQEGVVQPLPTREDLLKFTLGFDGLHLCV